MANERITEAITEWFGPRCHDYAEGCPCCDAWREFDALRDGALEEAAQAAETYADECDRRDGALAKGAALGATMIADRIRAIKELQQ